MQCRICGNSNTSILTDKLRRGKGIVYYCEKCKYGMLEPFFDDIEDYYDEEYRKTNKDVLDESKESPAEIFNMRVNFQSDRLDILKNYSGEGKSFLEIGSSAGQFLVHIAERYSEIVGIEIDKECAEFSKNMLIPINQSFMVYTGSLERVDKDINKKFDHIGFFQVLEHIADPELFMNIVSKHLKDDGKVFIEVPNLDDPLRVLWNAPSYETFYYHEAHLSYFSENSLRILLNNCDFKVDEVHYYQDYNLLNHLFWFFNNGPQKTCEFGLNRPIIDFLNKEVGSEVNELLVETNRAYFDILANHKMTSNFMIVASKS